MITEADLQQIAMELKDSTPLRLQVHPYYAYGVVAALQLASRHPELSAMQKDLVETFGRDLQKMIGSVSKLAAESLEAGWDRSQDVFRGRSA